MCCQYLPCLSLAVAGKGNGRRGRRVAGCLVLTAYRTPRNTPSEEGEPRSRERKYQSIKVSKYLPYTEYDRHDGMICIGRSRYLQMQGNEAGTVGIGWTGAYEPVIR